MLNCFVGRRRTGRGRNEDFLGQLKVSRFLSVLACFLCFTHFSKDVCNGTLTGLVVATSCCSVISPWAAVVAGVAAGAAYHGLARAMLALRLDDPVKKKREKKMISSSK